MATTIYFGTIQATLKDHTAGVRGAQPGTGAPVQQVHMARPVPLPSVAIINRYSEKLISDYKRKSQQVFDHLANSPAMKQSLERKRYGQVRRKGDRIVIQKCNNYRMTAMKEAERKAADVEKAFADGVYDDTVHIGSVKLNNLVQCGEQVSIATSHYRRTIKAQIKKRATLRKRTQCNVEDLMRKTVQCVALNNATIEIIEKRQRKIKCSYREHEGHRLPYIDLPHMHGRKVQRELDPSFTTKWLDLLVVGRRIRGVIHDEMVRPGWSGAVLNNNMARSICRYKYLIVRGRYQRNVIDARSKITHTMIDKMTHYSNEMSFFNGWRDVFNQLAPRDADHVCTILHDTFQCGRFAAAMSQMLYPCNKLSCPICRGRIEELTDEEFNRMLNTHLQDRAPVVQRLTSELPGIARVKKLVSGKTLMNPNIQAVVETQRLLLNNKATQMQQLAKVNGVLLKGNSAKPEDFSAASTALLEVSRWFANHLSLVAKGDLSTFRNKATSKAMLNPALMCDNQLDKNGNFVWGERGYHAKRIFQNYFEKVQPGDGYTKYVVRRNPNGTRQLAIGNLIVPLDLERARATLTGVSIERLPLTEACVSRQNGGFVHVCSCVTTDVGTPVYSDIKTPTKKHLVLGNAGDPKLVDLPQTDADNMTITKEGYCYLNIFLAMLVNVNEVDAKDFTKMFRDKLMPMLGTWPTMQDVATVCYILTEFFPETKSAELPRILVDHKARTMHVIDSYGSLTTGYHIMKTGTVAQLITFASNELTGEMKYYLVGGRGDVDRKAKLESLLIRAIFRPKLMEKILKDEPYVLLLSLLSPTIIVSMYNSGAFEKATTMWLRRNQTVGMIFSIMANLAQQVSRADMVVEQMEMINRAAQQVLDVQGDRIWLGVASFDVTAVLQNIVANERLDEDLVKMGFFGFNNSFYSANEKIYAQRLDAEWRELSWRQRFVATTDSYKSRPLSAKPLPLKTMKGLEDKFVTLPTYCFGKIRGHLNTRAQNVKTRCGNACDWLKRTTADKAFAVVARCYGRIFGIINVLLVLSLLLSIIRHVQEYIVASRQARALVEEQERQARMSQITFLFHQLRKELERVPKHKEMRARLETVNKDLLDEYNSMVGVDEVEEQAKTKSERSLEKVMAMMALVTMLYDTEKSDAVFKVLGKIKTVFSTMEEDVRHQSLDEIISIEDEKNLTVDFQLESEEHFKSVTMDATFEKWWANQLDQNRVVAHYRTGGCFIEFTRATSAAVCNDLTLSPDAEFLVRGAVGSGKSTGLPHGLSRKGRVLLLEPTRPLAENVCKQLKSEPFHASPTLRMRGMTNFGSGNITIMTSGFALHYYANNPQRLSEFAYIMIDESHTIDASTMAFYCLIKEYEYPGKILKVSATPPGRECEFKTQFEVKLKVEDELSFQQFVQSQGTGSNADVVQHGDNILVYVASYNDVDQLSKMLIEKKYHVTKVDGRTMKLGSVEIPTKGTSTRKHFVVATNIIENGVTLDIDVVVDFGMKVVAELDPDSRCVRYTRKAISYGERIQRLGRVGRVKNGFGLRIGHTETGLTEIPVMIATEAAFLCFAYKLPVMTHNVTTSIISKCTNMQARTMLQFELSPFFMVELVKYNGTMHPLVHNLLQPFKLRDSEIELNKLAIPNSNVEKWLSIGEYRRLGVRIEGDDSTRVPFSVRGIPDKLCTDLWKIVQEHKHEAGFGRLSSASASRIAYTLNTEPSALPRTLGIIEQLLTEEMQKKAHFESLNDVLCGQSFTLAGLVNNVRRRYLKDHSAVNIMTLQLAKAQLQDFGSQVHNLDNPESIAGYGFLDTVQYQSKQKVSEILKLKGNWNKSLLTKDLAVSGLIFFGGLWMLWEHFKAETEEVSHQGKNKRQRQKLKFRDAHDRKVGREVYGDDDTIEHLFGEAYTKKGKTQGNHKTRGMGRKTRNFIHLYGLDPAEYSFVRFVDPLTGMALDELPTADIGIIQSELAAARTTMIEADELDPQLIRTSPGVQAYFVKRNSDEVLKVDMTPHNPLAVGRSSASIAGFPERESELRQTGAPIAIPKSQMPENTYDSVAEEGKSLCRGLRNYNSISSAVCQLINESDGFMQTLHGIGYGPVIIANSHLFKQNNGTLLVRSHHGEYKVQNATQLRVCVMPKKDMIIIRMPKDFPPFPMRLRFRSPQREERAVLVGTLFQQKTLSSCVSESTLVLPTPGDNYWKHWVSTKDGDCGLPLVATKDGAVLGIHSLASTRGERNYFVPFTENFEDEVLKQLDIQKWVQHWRHTPDHIAWNGMNLVDGTPQKIFRASKLIQDLGFSMDQDDVVEQGRDYNDRWLYESLECNLKAVASSTSQLVTKHVIKGKCKFFEEYCATHGSAREFFSQFTGAYLPTRLNREAYKKDLLKYSTVTPVGMVDTFLFEKALSYTIKVLEQAKFGQCNYVTDEHEILGSLNLKAAVGALYTGKKKNYLEPLSDTEQANLVRASCLRLYRGDMGVWNGSLKAELRPKEKVDQNKTRSFTAAPIDTLLGGKVCVDDFNNRFYELNIQIPSTVGMTKFYTGWNKLMESLPEGWLYCDADGSQFDSSLTPYLINAVVCIREHFMEDWDIGLQMLRNLYTEIVYTPILTPDGTVVKKFKGNPSGQPSTVVDNTLMVILTMHYSLFKNGWNEEHMKNRVCFFANGDDLLIAIKPEFEPVLDSLTNLFGELGLKYDFTSRHRRRENLWFMSHRAIRTDGIYIPKLEEERIVSILEWDRSSIISHRAEAICAAMIEAWGYTELLNQIRLFYHWLMNKDEFKDMVRNGEMPYIAETALRRLYTNIEPTESELSSYWRAMLNNNADGDVVDEVFYQGKDDPPLDTGAGRPHPNSGKGIITPSGNPDRDIDAGSSGSIPRLKKISKMRMPRVGGKDILNLTHLLEYKPNQTDISNVRATQQQFAAWYRAVMEEYEVTEDQMHTLMNGLMVWCIENGTSPNINGVWTMMDGEEQVEYPLKPVVENAKPTFRQIMHHFSDAAEAYIAMRNDEKPYMPRYGLQRNLRDRTLARYAFDFYEVTSRTTERAKEAHMQMKAAALSNISNKMFGLDGNVATSNEDTERHTATDVNANMHTLLGVRQA